MGRVYESWVKITPFLVSLWQAKGAAGFCFVELAKEPDKKHQRQQGRITPAQAESNKRI